MSIEEIKMLANIYASLLLQDEVIILYSIITSPSRKGWVKGSYPLGEFFVYNYGHLFGSERDRVRTMEAEEEHLFSIIIINVSKNLLKTRTTFSGEY